MLTVIGIMCIGIITGRLLRSRRLGLLSAIINIMIWALLLFLGIAVGANEDIVDTLDTIGVKALIITLFAVFGSITAAFFIYKYMFQKK